MEQVRVGIKRARGVSIIVEFDRRKPPRVGDAFSLYMGNSGTLSGHGFPYARPPAYCSDRSSCRHTSDSFRVDEGLLIMMGPKQARIGRGVGEGWGRRG